MDTVYLNTRKTDDFMNGGYILFNKKKEPIIVYSDTIEESLLKDFFGK
jgi:hypothetical protein